MTVKCSIAMRPLALLKIKQSRRRIDRHCTVGEIDFVDNFFDGRNQMFFAPALHQIEFAAGSRQSGLQDPDALTTRGENLETDDLIVIVLAGGQDFESAFRDREGCAYIVGGSLDAVDLLQFDQQLVVMRSARFKQKSRLLSRSVDKDFGSTLERCRLGIKRIELQPAEQAVGRDNFTEGN
jgi:hypothetical protein